MPSKFWLTFFSLITLIFSLILIIKLGNDNYFHNRSYGLLGLLFIPIFIYQIIQFCINYIGLTENNKK